MFQVLIFDREIFHILLTVFFNLPLLTRGTRPFGILFINQVTYPPLFTAQLLEAWVRVPSTSSLLWNGNAFKVTSYVGLALQNS